ncbi:MAG: DegT/DnrJ/EryC1/StrS family aminotransferase [Candidatus Omnitrophota bacterium]|nr:DegT/DnrJ/EryC1/StrS family aminotransferase [Candidatus Omnitrophota bacterium]
MIPRLKPYFNNKELGAVFSKERDPVGSFEKKFAAKFKAKYAVAFLYGRSGLYALLKCLGLRDSEVIMPAYTCVVVPNAVVFSDNTPRFVDVGLDNYNMDLDLLEKAIGGRTGAIIGTSLFGYPYDADRLKEIIKRSGRKILLIQDCAHSFGAEYKGEPLCNMGDAALFAFSLNKQISAVYGGMITTNSEEIYIKLKRYREENFKEPSRAENLKMLSLLIAAYAAFFDPFYGFVDFLERRTKVLDGVVKYYNEEVIDMPEDFMVKLPRVNARIGSIQIDKYDEIVKRRREIAEFYNKALKPLIYITPPHLIEGATYLYCAAMVDKREDFIEYMRNGGIQIGRYLEYAIPYMKAYKKYKNGDYPNAYLCGRNIVNLPCYYSLSDAGLQKIAKRASNYLA